MRDFETFGSPLTILPTQNPVIFNNFFLEKEAFATVSLCRREKKMSCFIMK